MSGIAKNVVSSELFRFGARALGILILLTLTGADINDRNYISGNVYEASV